jgi:penicillin-binding protein A
MLEDMVVVFLVGLLLTTQAVASRSIDLTNKPEGLHIHWPLQDHLQRYIQIHGGQVAAVVVADVKTGNILAMAEGRRVDHDTHTALFSRFPAASIFKTVTASAAIEYAKMNPFQRIPLQGGCADVRANGVWMLSGPRASQLSLRRAYADSCNGFFAKLITDYVGLSMLRRYSERFGWSPSVIKADFDVPESQIALPEALSASAHHVGRFTAGFGRVGLSAVHATWQMLALANHGMARPLRLFQNTNTLIVETPMVEEDTASELRDMMNGTVRGGTASYAFRPRKFAKLRSKVGGKTGTLSSQELKGVATWFAGMMPLDEPEVVVVAVVLLEGLWHIKGPNLAAEAMWYYDKKVAPVLKQQQDAESSDPSENMDSLIREVGYE